MAASRGTTVVYAAETTGFASFVTPPTITLTAGRSLVLTIQWVPSSVSISSITITDNSNATLIAGSLITFTSESAKLQHAVLPNITSAGTKTVQVNFSGSTTVRSIGCQEYIGLDTTSPEGASNTGQGNSANPSISLTTTAANSLIVATVQTTGGADPTAGGSYTLLGTDRPDVNWWEEDEDDLDAGAAGARNVDFIAGSGNWAISAVEYKIAGGDASAALSGSASTGGSGTGVPGIEIGL